MKRISQGKDERNDDERYAIHKDIQYDLKKMSMHVFHLDKEYERKTSLRVMTTYEM